MLNKNIEKYAEEKKFIFAYDMHSLLPSLKKSEEFAWLKECPSQVLQQKCQDLILLSRTSSNINEDSRSLCRREQIEQVSGFLKESSSPKTN